MTLLKSVVLVVLSCFTATCQSTIPFNETITFEDSNQEVSIARCYLPQCTTVEYIQEVAILNNFQTALIETLKNKQIYAGICLGLNCTVELSQTVPTYLSVGKTEICEELGCDVDIGNTVTGYGNVISQGNTAVSGGSANVGNIVYAEKGAVNVVSIGNTASGNGPVNSGNTVFADGNAPVNMVSSGNTAVSTGGSVNVGNVMVIGDINGRKLLALEDVHKCGAEFVDVPPCCLEEIVVEDVKTCNFASGRGVKCRHFKLVNGHSKNLSAEQVVQTCA